MLTGRFAPTPSGYLHPGNLVCALLAWLSVRSRGGRFLLRIEDLDVPRCPKRLADRCVEDLTWLGLDWDEPPVYQSQRTEAYAAALERLRTRGLVYPCFCTRAQLHASAAPNLGDRRFVYPGTCARLTPAETAARAAVRAPAYRLRVPEEPVTYTDLLLGERRESPATESGDFILRRSDGLFAYQLAVVVDDAAGGVTEVVRGCDILGATPGQVWLQRCLGADTPVYAHIPLMTDADGRRLAKRDGDISVQALSKRFTAPELCGLLAMAAGLQEEPEPKTPEQLVPLMRWDRVRTGGFRLPERLTGGDRQLPG